MKKLCLFVFLTMVVSTCFAGNVLWLQNDFRSGKWILQSVLYFPFDDGTAADQSGYGNNGTISGAAPVAGKYGLGLRFDGVDDSIQVNDASSLDNMSAITIEAWVYPQDAAKLFNRIVGRSWASEGSYLFMIYNNAAAFGLVLDGAQRNAVGGTIANDKWYHLVGIYDGSNVSLYVNGVSVASTNYAKPFGTIDSVIIGGSSVDSCFKGILDELRIYRRALSSSEVSSLHAGGAPANFMTPGIYVSPPCDFGCTATIGKIEWKIDLPSGCSVPLYVSTAAAEEGLEKSWTFVCTITTPVGSVEPSSILPSRWLKYKAVVIMPGSNVEVKFREMKFLSAVEGITVLANASPTYILKSGEDLQFSVRFAIEMKNEQCTVTVRSGGGNTVALSGGAWSDSNSWVSDLFNIPDFTYDGFAAAEINGGRTAAGNRPVKYYWSELFIIDTQNKVSKGRLEFFPNPFSPNGDGRADEARLMFTIPSLTTVSAKIYDLKGSLVGTLADGQQMAGNVTLTWDGTDNIGLPCPVGLYICQLKIGDAVRSCSVVLAK